MIKSYPDGVVAKYLCELKVGDTVEVKGPFPKLKYSPNMKKSIGMVAGGTGITPMLQVIQEVLRNAEDKTELHLIFANNGEEDILLKDLLDSLAVKHKNFKVTYVLSKAPANWAGATGNTIKYRICYSILASLFLLNFFRMSRICHQRSLKSQTPCTWPVSSKYDVT